jgi:hypothetical protein
MKLRQINSTLYPIPFLMINSTDHLAGATGIVPTVTLSKNCASFANASGSITEIGNGWYSLTPNTNDRNTLGELIVHASGIGADPYDEKYLIVPWNPFDAVRLGLTSLPTVSVENSVWDAVISPQSHNNAQSAGRILRTTNGASGSTTAIRTGTAQGGTSTSITLDSSASSVNDTYANTIVGITAGTGAGQSAIIGPIGSYNGATKIATITTIWSTIPDNTSQFEILPMGVVTVNKINSGGILASSFATNSIDSNAFAQSAADKIWASSSARASAIDTLELFSFNGSAVNSYATNMITDYQERSVAVTLPIIPPSGYGGGSGNQNTYESYRITPGDILHPEG